MTITEFFGVFFQELSRQEMLQLILRYLGGALIFDNLIEVSPI